MLFFKFFRTKGLPVKGSKRDRPVDTSESDEDSVKNIDMKRTQSRKKMKEESTVRNETPVEEKATCWWPTTSQDSSETWRRRNNSSPLTSGQSTAMTELTNLVNAHPKVSRPLRMPVQEVIKHFYINE